MSDRILLLLQHGQNRNLLADWLSRSYAIVKGELLESPDEPLDLCIVDPVGLARVRAALITRKRAEEPAFLPVLLVGARADLGVSAWNIWQAVDEIISTPIEKRELQARVEILLRSRRLSRQNVALRRQLEAELARAGEVQAGLLPGTSFVSTGCEVAGRCLPAREVGGDFYDWHEPSPGVLTLTLADVMGKGMPAALLMATVRATLRGLSLLNDPEMALTLANAALAQDFERSDSFVTLFHARVDCHNRRLLYADAGHGLVLFKRANGLTKDLTCRGFPLGVVSEESYEQEAIDLWPDDLLAVYSDGLVESRTAGAVYPKTLADYLDNTLTAEENLEKLLALPKLKESLPDDLTVMVLKCLG